ncbi:MAG: hypothetical protein H6621_06140 [Halobacteriovoraceae bacterium]|nr:hypothetical protein [Halobacteriovoraceae bacterium]
MSVNVGTSLLFIAHDQWASAFNILEAINKFEIKEKIFFYSPTTNHYLNSFLPHLSNVTYIKDLSELKQLNQNQSFDVYNFNNSKKVLSEIEQLNFQNIYGFYSNYSKNRKYLSDWEAYLVSQFVNNPYNTISLTSIITNILKESLNPTLKYNYASEKTEIKFNRVFVSIDSYTEPRAKIFWINLLSELCSQFPRIEFHLLWSPQLQFLEKLATSQKNIKKIENLQETNETLNNSLLIGDNPLITYLTSTVSNHAFYIGRMNTVALEHFFSTSTRNTYHETDYSEKSLQKIGEDLKKFIESAGKETDWKSNSYSYSISQHLLAPKTKTWKIKSLNHLYRLSYHLFWYYYLKEEHINLQNVSLDYSESSQNFEYHIDMLTKIYNLMEHVITFSRKIKDLSDPQGDIIVQYYEFIQEIHNLLAIIVTECNQLKPLYNFFAYESLNFSDILVQRIAEKFMAKAFQVQPLISVIHDIFLSVAEKNNIRVNL